MRKALILTTAGSALAICLPAQANAAQLLFELTGPDMVSFFLESDPVVPDINIPGIFDQIGFTNVPITINGTSQTSSSIRFNRRNGGSLVINGTSLGVATFTGPRLFTRTGSTIAFVEGDFALARTLGGGNYQLTIAQVSPPAIPEPATWALMLLGFAAVGGAIRARRRRETLRVTYA